MKFKKRAIIIELDESNYHIRITLSTVIELIWSRDGTNTYLVYGSILLLS